MTDAFELQIAPKAHPNRRQSCPSLSCQGLVRANARRIRIPGSSTALSPRHPGQPRRRAATFLIGCVRQSCLPTRWNEKAALGFCRFSHGDWHPLRLKMLVSVPCPASTKALDRTILCLQSGGGWPNNWLSRSRKRTAAIHTFADHACAEPSAPLLRTSALNRRPAPL